MLSKVHGFTINTYLSVSIHRYTSIHVRYMYLQTIHMYHLCMQHVCVYRSVSWVGGGAYMYDSYVSYVSALYPDVSTPAPQDTCIQVYLACIWHVSWSSSGFDPNTSRIRVIRSRSYSCIPRPFGRPSYDTYRYTPDTCSVRE